MRLNVLVVDDVPEVPELVATWLERHGHSVARASTGAEGSRLIKAQPFDLIITDVLMPEVDGLDLIKQAKHQQPNARIMAISGGGKYMAATTCMELARSMGATTLLPKPFNEAQLMQSVITALAGDAA